MPSDELLSLGARSAYLSAGATIATLLTGFLFFAKGEPFGTVNDAASVFQALFMLPLPWALRRILGQPAPGLSVAAGVIGATGIVSMGVLQALLVFRKVTFEQTFGAVLAGGSAMGVWLVAAGCLTFAGGDLPAPPASLAIVAGGGYLLSAGAYFVTRRQGIAFFLGAASGLVSYSVWAIWLGRVLQRG